MLRRLRDADRESFERWSATWIHPLYWIRRCLREAVAKRVGYVRGRVLDAGAGGRPYEALLRRTASSYLSADWLSPAAAGGVLPDVSCDIVRLPFADYSFDAVICTEVLEHVLDPGLAVRELWRVLAVGGRVVCSVPFAFPVHDLYDYRRLTELGLRRLFEQEGFEIIETAAVCGSGRTLAVLLNLYLFDLGGYWCGRLYLLSLILRPLIWIATAAVNLAGQIGDAIINSRHLSVGHLIVGRRSAGGSAETGESE
jgi:SAM-dependent methyltransferase